MTSQVGYHVVPSTDRNDTTNSFGTKTMTIHDAETKIDCTKSSRNDSPCGCFHKPAWVLLAICLAGFLQGVVTDGFVNTCVTSLERRFGLSSTQSGIIISIYFFTGVFVNLFVGYFGDRGHKARWVAGGMVLYSAGTLLFSLPHFMSGYYQYTEIHEYSFLCDSEVSEITISGASNTSENASLHGGESSYLYLFVLAQVLLGVGAAPLFTLGIPYLDENVTVDRSSLYLGILYAVATLGPAVGYIAGGIFLSVYTDFRKAEEVTITPEDPTWVGAWWFGMVLAFPISILSAAFLFIFPKELPGTDEIRKQKTSQAHKSSGNEIISSRADFGRKPKDFLIALTLLLRNPTLMFINGVAVCSAMLTMGYAAYLPKIVETQFGQTASFSATAVGATVVLGGSVGSVIGGWLVKRFKWNIRSNIIFCIASTVIVLALLHTFLLRCSNNQTAILEPIDLELTGSSCHSDCGCSTLLHTPVCARDQQIEYFSPCHAGCRYELENNTYGGCSCVSEEFVIQKGPCEAESCPQLIIFIIGLFLLIFMGFLPAIAALQVTLRCVPESQRSFSLGLINVMAKIFGSFPSPIIFGAMFDSTCVVWQTGQTESEQGSCWLYDVNKLSLRLYLFSECMMAIAVVFYLLAYYMYQPVENTEETKPGSELEEKRQKEHLQSA